MCVSNLKLMEEFFFLFIVHADVLSKGIWQTVSELHDPELKRLAAIVISIVILCSILTLR